LTESATQAKIFSDYVGIIKEYRETRLRASCSGSQTSPVTDRAIAESTNMYQNCGPQNRDWSVFVPAFTGALRYRQSGIDRPLFIAARARLATHAR
jgi:hypothetical protein